MTSTLFDAIIKKDNVELFKQFCKNFYCSHKFIESGTWAGSPLIARYVLSDLTKYINATNAIEYAMNDIEVVRQLLINKNIKMPNSTNFAINLLNSTEDIVCCILGYQIPGTFASTIRRIIITENYIVNDACLLCAMQILQRENKINDLLGHGLNIYLVEKECYRSLEFLIAKYGKGNVPIIKKKCSLEMLRVISKYYKIGQTCIVLFHDTHDMEIIDMIFNMLVPVEYCFMDLFDNKKLLYKYLDKIYTNGSNNTEINRMIKNMKRTYSTCYFDIVLICLN